MILQCCLWTVLAARAAGDWVQLPVLAPAVSTAPRPSHSQALNTSEQLRNDTVNNSTNIQHNATSENNSQHFEIQSNVKIDKSEKLVTMNYEEINGTKTKSAFDELPIEMLNTVHRTLLQETPDTVQGKMQFLQRLKEKLSNYMELRIKKLWAVEDRQGRTDKGMGFPSMEGALMTICFLLFAVFLVKLVQQLIQSLQNGNMTTAGNTAMLMTMVPAVMPPAGGRRRRFAADTLETARILQLMDEFQIRHIQGGL